MQTALYENIHMITTFFNTFSVFFNVGEFSDKHELIYLVERVSENNLGKTVCFSTLPHFSPPQWEGAPHTQKCMVRCALSHYDLLFTVFVYPSHCITIKFFLKISIEAGVNDMEGDTEQELFTWSFSSSNLIFLQTGQDDFIIAIWRIRFSFLYTFHLERSFGILDKGEDRKSVV